jgi:hypothetical protein
MHWRGVRGTNKIKSNDSIQWSYLIRVAWRLIIVSYADLLAAALAVATALAVAAALALLLALALLVSTALLVAAATHLFRHTSGRLLSVPLHVSNVTRDFNYQQSRFVGIQDMFDCQTSIPGWRRSGICDRSSLPMPTISGWDSS